MNHAKRNLDLILVALLAIFALAPLTSPGFFFGQDGLATVYNLADFRQSPSLSWRPGLGLETQFGSVALLPYYLGALLASLGFSSVGAIKALYAAGFILSATGAYALAGAIFRAGALREAPQGAAPRRNPFSDDRPDHFWRLPAILAGVIYTYLPYHLASTYVRADLGESLAFGLAPWAGVCLWRLAEGAFARPERMPRLLAWLALSSLLLTGLLLADQGLGLTVALLLMGAALVAVSHPPARSFPLRGALVVAVPVVVGLTLALPQFSSAGFSTDSQGAGTPQMVEFSRLWSPEWGDATGAGDGLPLQLGLVAGALALLSFVPGAVVAGGQYSGRSTVRYLQVVTVILVALMLPPLAPVWPALGQLAGEPFRLLFVLALPLSILGGSLLLGKGRAQPLTAIALVMLAVLGSYNYLSPRLGPVDEPSRLIAGKAGEDIVLLDYRFIKVGSVDPVAAVGRGEEVRLRLIWQALRSPKDDFTVFTHLLDGGEQVRGQHDGQPAAGTRPTSRWRAGEVIVDDHVLRVDSDAPPGDSAVEVGMYLSQTGQRLPIAIAGRVDTRVVLHGLKVGG